MTEQEVRYQDNLYEAVNGEWEAKTEIPADKSRVGGFNQLADDVEAQLMNDLDAMAAGDTAIPNKHLQNAITLYNKAADFETRDAAGIQPALTNLAQQDLNDFASFNTHAVDWANKGFNLPFSLSVQPDMKDTRRNLIYLEGPSMILPDTTYYAADNEQGKALLATWSAMAQELLALTPLSSEEQASYLEGALAFDARVAAHVKSSEEWADYPKSYNPEDFATVAAKFADFKFADYVEKTFGEQPEIIVVSDPKFLDAFSEIFNADNFDDFKQWAYVRELIADSSYLSEELRQLGGQYKRALYGTPEEPSQAKHAYRLANAYFDEPIGMYYGDKYFGQKAKADVTALVEQMIDTYKERLTNSPWLSEPTKKKAIVKLDAMVLKMGYPDKVNPFYETVTVDENDDLLTIVNKLGLARRAYNIGQLNKPVDRTTWNMPGNLVNASYDPSRNDITFPAAILQAPFYSLEQSSSQNLGGIGAVIAHEISHGFDNNGAQFDELGNLTNWWQEADYAHFKELTQAMIDEFDGLETVAGPANGKLIVSENIADAGGLAVALATAKKQPDADLKAFFVNWARIWRQKARLELLKMFLNVDVHAPAVLRANVQPQNLDDWYTTFDVKPTDKMYLPPEKRLTIW